MKNIFIQSFNAGKPEPQQHADELSSSALYITDVGPYECI